MKLRTLIIDDEPIALEKLRNYVGKVPFLELAGEFQSGFEAIEYLSSGHAVDLIFTDINMPDLSGMDFVKSLATPPMVIFITAHSQYAVDSYRLSAVDYLLKPYGFADFHRAATKALELAEARAARTGAAGQSAPESLFVRMDHRYVRVSLAQIRFIKGYGEYLQIYVEGSPTPLLTLSSFASVKEHLSDHFLQVHRSYIVNMDRVAHIERNRLVMDSDTYIPVGDSYKPQFQQYLASHTVGKS